MSEQGNLLDATAAQAQACRRGAWAPMLIPLFVRVFVCSSQEDYDNYIDIILDASSPAAAAALTELQAFRMDEGYAPLYNPGGCQLCIEGSGTQWAPAGAATWGCTANNRSCSDGQQRRLGASGPHLEPSAGPVMRTGCKGSEPTKHCPMDSRNHPADVPQAGPATHPPPACGTAPPPLPRCDPWRCHPRCK